MLDVRAGYVEMRHRAQAGGRPRLDPYAARRRAGGNRHRVEAVREVHHHDVALGRHHARVLHLADDLGEAPGVRVILGEALGGVCEGGGGGARGASRAGSRTAAASVSRVTRGAPRMKRGCTPASAAIPAISQLAMWESSCTKISVPGTDSAQTAPWVAIVPAGNKSARAG